MTQGSICIDDRIIEDFIDLHVDVLKRVLLGQSFEEIEFSLSNRFRKLTYSDLSLFFSLLHFTENGQLTRAYPISPIPTTIRISVDGLGSGHAMCAIDSLGVAYLFDAVTEINSIDVESGNPIRITIDPHESRVKGFGDVIVSMPTTIEEAAFCCPHVRFLCRKGQGHVTKGSISFEEALDYGKTFFERANMGSKLKSKIVPLVHIYETGMCTSGQLIKILTDGPRFSLLGSLFPNDYGRIMVDVLSAKNAIHKTRTKYGEYLDLTPRGKRIVDTFRG